MSTDKEKIKVSNYTYPIHSLKHKFAKKLIKDRSGVTDKIAISSAIIAIATIYSFSGVTEDNIQTEYAPLAAERIMNETSNLAAQKDLIYNIRKQQKLLGFGQGDVPLEELEKLEDDAILSLKRDSEKTLNYILTNEDLSEEQIRDAWQTIANNIIEPASITEKFDNTKFFSNDYDFEFVKECRAESMSDMDNLSTSELSDKVNSCLADGPDNYEGFSPFVSITGALAWLLVGVPVSVFSESKTADRWAREKPVRKNKPGSNRH